MEKKEMAKAYAEGFAKEYREIAYDAFLCGYDAKCSTETPNDLEEAAEISFDEARALTEGYSYFLAKGLKENHPRPIGPHWFCEYAKNRFIAGAKWQKEQMMKEAVEIEWKSGTMKKDGKEVSFDGGKAKIIIVALED